MFAERSLQETLIKILDFLNGSELFADLLKCYLKERGIGQAQFAKMIFVDRSTVSLWCSGKRIPSDVYPISKALKLNQREQKILLQAWMVVSIYQQLCTYIESALMQENSSMEDLTDIVKTVEETLAALSIDTLF